MNFMLSTKLSITLPNFYLIKEIHERKKGVNMNELDQLRQFKEQEKISYEKLAHKIGVSYRTLFRWLNRDSKPSDMGLKVIKEFLGRKK